MLHRRNGRVPALFQPKPVPFYRSASQSCLNFPLCSSMRCLPTYPKSRAHYRAVLRVKMRFSLPSPGTDVPPCLEGVCPPASASSSSWPGSIAALPTHRHATGGCPVLIPMNRQSSSCACWVRPCAFDRVSRADELYFKTQIKDTFFPSPKSCRSVAFVL